MNITFLVEKEPHLRGCVCRLKTCVKLCCELGLTGIPNTWNCSEFNESDLAIHVNITLNNGSKISVPVSEFTIQEDIPCLESYTLVPHENPEHEWELFENGTLALPKIIKYVSKNEYCLNPQKSLNGKIHVMTSMYCNKGDTSASFIVNNIPMAISVPFLLLTAIVYMAVPRLRTFHGKCLISYLIALAVGYASLVTLNFNLEIPGSSCRILGYLTYFSFLAAFAWLSVIGFDLRRNVLSSIPVNRRLNPLKTFSLYCTFAWGVPAVLTGITVFIQYFYEKVFHKNIPPEWKPQIGSENFCWLPTDSWSPMIYFYSIMLFAVLVNLFTFIYTTYKIPQLKQNINSIGRKEANEKHLELFVRLFILMGLTWLFEIGSFLVGSIEPWSFVFYPADFINSIQGIIIFILVLCRKESLKKSKERFKPNAKKHSRTQIATLSTNDN